MNGDLHTARVIRHSDPMVFLAAAAPVLARDDAMASSYVAWANGLLRNPAAESERVCMATYADGDAVGAAVLRGLGGLWVGASDPVAAIAFADDMFTQGKDSAHLLQGVVGIRSACEAFAGRWLALTGQQHALRVNLRNHRLTRVESVPQPSGAARGYAMRSTISSRRSISRKTLRA
jgi:hypothetical protein